MAAVAVGSEATHRGGKSNGLQVGNQSSPQQLMDGLLLSMQIAMDTESLPLLNEEFWL